MRTRDTTAVGCDMDYSSTCTLNIFNQHPQSKTRRINLTKCYSSHQLVPFKPEIHMCFVQSKARKIVCVVWQWSSDTHL